MINKVRDLANKGFGYRRIASTLGISERKAREALKDAQKLRSIGKTKLIMGDPHAKPSEANDRFTIAGKLAYEREVDDLICVGDWGDMESLSSYDKGKRSAEGKRYIDDVNSAIDAQEKLIVELPEYTNLFMLGGNHDEARMARATNDNPSLFGAMGIEDLQYKEFGWNYTPFKDVLELDGIAFSHYFTSGRMDNPISGEYQAAAILRKKHQSSICGHSHIYDYRPDTLANGKKIFGLVAGCFFESPVTYVSKSEQRNWWRGLILLHEVETENGTEWDVEQISMDRLKQMYA